MKPRTTQSARPKRTKPVVDAPRSVSPQLVQIEKPIYGGAFLARVEGKAVFVPLTLPGEQARVRITGDKRGYATAEVEEIVAAAPQRVMPACRHFGTCGGCNYQHADYGTQLAFKKAILRETLERGGVRAPEEIQLLAATSVSQSWGYRNRIRLAFDAHGNPGYRGRRSHEIIPIRECPVAAPLLVTTAMALANSVRKLGPSLRLSEFSIFSNASENSSIATLFTATSALGRAETERFREIAATLASQVPALKGVELVAQSQGLDRIPSKSPRTIAQWGESSLSYRAAGFDYRVDHGAFFQVNRWLVDRLVEEVATGKRGSLAWDLFAGVGPFARKLTAAFDRVVAVESAPQATAALEENLSGTSSSAVRASTLDFLRRSQKTVRPDFIVVDPPRSGLGAEVTTSLAEIGAPALTYVSCDPATLARDLRTLVDSGYVIQSLTLADLFPHTFHLEAVVHLRRS
jgi:23S rRNA (uracil1939-C5)-methyltransferase